MVEYYKFHRTDTPMGCERSCTMLNITNTDDPMGENHKIEEKERREKIDFSSDTALAFFTAADPFGKLQSLRKLNEKNFICMGNKTSSMDTQCFRIIVGGGTNLVDPVWQFCNISSISATSVVEFCVRDWTECSARVIDQPLCQAAGTVDDDNDDLNDKPLKGPHPPTTGMYILMYDDKGEGWSGAMYMIIYLPATVGNLFLSLIGLVPPPVGALTKRTTSSSPSSSTASSTASASSPYSSSSSSSYTSLEDGDLPKVDDKTGTDPSPTSSPSANPSSSPDPGPYPGSNSADPAPYMGYALVAVGALEMGKQTGYASLCLRDGCYVADFSMGTKPEQVAWVLCGVIGAAGMEGVFQVQFLHGIFSVFLSLSFLFSFLSFYVLFEFNFGAPSPSILILEKW